MSPRRGAVRVLVPDVPLDIQLQPEQVAVVPPPRRGERVMAVPDTRATAAQHFRVTVNGWSLEVRVEPARRAELRERAARAAAEHQPHTRQQLRAQIPGRVVRVWVEQGQAVEQGERLLAVEAMKMENEVRAPRAGVVEAIHVELGGRVERDDELLTLG